MTPAELAEKGLAKLESFRTFKKGWDGYDSDPPSDSSLELARGLIGALLEHGLRLKKVMPDVCEGVGIRIGKAYVWVCDSSFVVVPDDDGGNHGIKEMKDQGDVALWVLENYE